MRQISLVLFGAPCLFATACSDPDGTDPAGTSTGMDSGMPSTGAGTGTDESADASSTASSAPTTSVDSTGDGESSSTGGGVCVDADGDGAGGGCGVDDCDDGNPHAIDDCIYVAPDGNDDGAGTREDPWCTFATAMGAVVPGGSIIALDGLYDAVEHGPSGVDCPADLGAGTEAMPIVIRAENPREVELAYVELRGCEHVRFEGFTMRGGMVVEGGADLVFRGLLATVEIDTTPIQVRGGQRILLEDLEVYSPASGVLFEETTDSTVRRAYLQSVDRGASSFGGIYIVNGPGTTIENVVVEGFFRGVDLRRGSDAAILGSVFHDNGTGVYAESNQTPSTLADLRVQDVAVLGAVSQGVEIASGFAAEVRHVTIVAAGGNGIELQRDQPGSCVAPGCSGVVRDAFVASAGGAGISLAGGATYEAESCRIDPTGVVGLGIESEDAIWDDDLGAVRTSSALEVPEVGAPPQACPIAIDPDSALAGLGTEGSDIGANVTQRYVDRVPTGERLWTELLAFPCGPIVAGVNDGSGTCHDVHERLGVTGPCAFVGE